MRAKFVNEALINESFYKNLSFEEAVKLAKEAVSKNPKEIRGPSITKSFKDPTAYAIDHGGVSTIYKYDSLNKLLHAMQVVEDKDTNVKWSVHVPDENDKYPVAIIDFISDEEIRAQNSITTSYKQRSGNYVGD